MNIRLSKTSTEILRIFQGNNNQPLFVNEIIRITKSFPNSIQRSLETLQKQSLLLSQRRGNKRYFSLNKNHKKFPEIKALVSKDKSYIEKEKPKYIKWVNRECSVALNTAIGSAQANLKYIKRFRIQPVKFLWYNSVTGGVYNSVNEIERIGKTISREVKKDSTFARELAASCLKDGEKLIKQTRKSAQINLKKLPRNKLFSMFNNIHELFLRFMPYFVIPHAIEQAIGTELEKLVVDKAAKEKLIEPVTILSDEQSDEMLLADAVKKKGWTSKNKSKLKKLTEKYCWMPMMALHHKPFGVSHFKKIINGLVDNIFNPAKELSKLQKLEKIRKNELEEVLNKIHANKNLRNLVNTTQAYLYLRTYRVNITKKFHYYHLPILHEIAKRMNISNIDITFINYYEILDFLKGKLFKSDIKKLAKARKRGFANLTWNGKSKVIAGIENIIEAIEYYNIFAGTSKVEQVIRGNTACKGTAKGTVRIIKSKSELSKMKPGDILVARMTTPDYMIAIKKASAIVTDEGGITCHASIVSREYNIPCIVGTKNATHLLNDGDIVEVDANNGTVEIIDSTQFQQSITKLHGKKIYGGKVTGTARIILDTRDFNKLRDGDIVIAAQTNPEYLSLLYRSSGFVVDEESISSHAVLYGKALQMPSIMGTYHAKKAFADGDKIELNATQGIVRKLAQS